MTAMSSWDLMAGQAGVRPALTGRPRASVLVIGAGVSGLVVGYELASLGYDLRILEGRCQRIVFFEDPHVARQHEADIQLLERSARIATERAMCVSDEATAARWVAGCEARERLR